MTTTMPSFTAITHPPGVELDRLIHERVFGLPVTSSEYAMVRLGVDQTVMTGTPWRLRTGDDIVLPKGADLPQPETSPDRNSRYFLYLGRWLVEHYPGRFDEFLSEVRLPVPEYSTDWRHAGALVEHLQQKQWAVRWSNKTEDWCWWAYVWYYGEPTEYTGLKADGTGQGDTAPHALCLAILNALEPSIP